MELRDNTEIVGVILSGEKGVFSSGNDLKDKNAFGAGLDLLKARQQNRLGLRMCDAWNNLPQITIASIEGACIGGGVSIALSCDFRFCSVNAYFHAPEVDLGDDNELSPLQQYYQKYENEPESLPEEQLYEGEEEGTYQAGSVEDYALQGLAGVMDTAENMAEIFHIPQMHKALSETVEAFDMDSDKLVFNIKGFKNYDPNRDTISFMSDEEFEKLVDQFDNFLRAWEKEYNKKNPKKKKKTDDWKPRMDDIAEHCSLEEISDMLIDDLELTPEERFELYYEEHTRVQKQKSSFTLNQIMKKAGIKGYNNGKKKSKRGR